MLEIVPLGGVGEFGMNMLAISWAETTIVVDAGVMFPDPELLGVDRIIPDLTYLQQKGGAAALVLTHGHEDHIGGVPHVMTLLHGPIYGTALTLAMVEPKLEEHGIDGRELIAVRPHDRVTVGPFEVVFTQCTAAHNSSKRIHERNDVVRYDASHVVKINIHSPWANRDDIPK